MYLKVNSDVNLHKWEHFIYCEITDVLLVQYGVLLDY